MEERRRPEGGGFLFRITLVGDDEVLFDCFATPLVVFVFAGGGVNRTVVVVALVVVFLLLYFLVAGGDGWIVKNVRFLIMRPDLVVVVVSVDRSLLDTTGVTVCCFVIIVVVVVFDGDERNRIEDMANGGSGGDGVIYVRTYVDKCLWSVANSLGSTY